MGDQDRPSEQEIAEAKKMAYRAEEFFRDYCILVRAGKGGLLFIASDDTWARGALCLVGLAIDDKQRVVGRGYGGAGESDVS